MFAAKVMLKWQFRLVTERMAIGIDANMASFFAPLWRLIHVRPMSLQIPSVYWPVARIGFSRDRKLRRAFRFLFCKLYRKRFWNPIMSSWTKDRGFDQRRHLSASNIHAACSAVVLFLIVSWLYFAHRGAICSLPQVERACYLRAAATAMFELVFNAPAIVLTRYLYLLTLRRPGLNRP